MAKIWNPRARRETVAEFVGAWCVRGEYLFSDPDILFGAYEYYCRANRLNDLTRGEFDSELVQLGISAGKDYWKGLALAVMGDVLVRRGPRFRIRKDES